MTSSFTRFTLAALFTLCSFAAVAQQSGSATAGELRGSGGEIELPMRGSRNLSGSLGMSLSDSFGLTRPGYEATLGGTLFADRLWFFAAGSQTQVPAFTSPYMAGNSTDFSANAIAEFGRSHDLAASYRSGRDTFGLGALTTTAFSMNYLGIISPNMFFSASMSRDRTEPSFTTSPPAPK